MSTPPPLVDTRDAWDYYLGPLDVAKSLVMGQRWVYEARHPCGVWMVRFSEQRHPNGVIPMRLASEEGNATNRITAWRRALGEFFAAHFIDEEHARIAMRQERLLMTLGFGRV